MKALNEWIDKMLGQEIPKEVVAINFNLYEQGDGEWSMEMVGTSSFDEEDEDWACDEVYDARDDIWIWTQDADWEEIQEQIVEQVENYLKVGKYADKLRTYQGIGVGFVDGDITIVHKK